MTAKISEDCRNGSRRKIKQVISGERGETEVRGCDVVRCCQLSPHMCGCRRVRNCGGRCCAAAVNSEKWWVYVNRAPVRCVFVYGVVMKSFVKTRRSCHCRTSAPTPADVPQLYSTPGGGLYPQQDETRTRPSSVSHRETNIKNPLDLVCWFGLLIWSVDLVCLYCGHTTEMK